MELQNLSHRERVAAYRLEASKLVQAAQRLELQANLMELTENFYEMKTKLSKLCPESVLRTFDEQLSRSEQDQAFLTQTGIANLSETNGSM